MKWIILTGSMIAITSILLASTPGMANAGNGGAIVINDSRCGLFDGNGSNIFVSDSHEVGAFSKNGNSMIWCKATGVAHPGGPAVIFQGSGHDNGKATTIIGLCNTLLGATPNWFNIVTPSGKSMLICIFPGGN